MTKIKIKAYQPTGAEPIRGNGGKGTSVPGQAPPVQPEVKKEQSFISKCVSIIKQDIRNVIHGEEEIKMPESKESWNDWEGEL